MTRACYVINLHKDLQRFIYKSSFRKPDKTNIYHLFVIEVQSHLMCLKYNYKHLKQALTNSEARLSFCPL